MSVATLDSTDTVELTVSRLREAALAKRSVTMSSCERVRVLMAARNALDAEIAAGLAEIDATKAHEAEGCASVATWAARELHQDVATTRQMVRAAKTMRELPSIGEAAHAGEVSLEHVHALTYGLKHVGADLADFEAELKTMAEELQPTELFGQMRILKAVAHPEELDQAWLRGMDKMDLQCLKVLDGWHVTGHLPVDVGAKLRVFLQTVAVPRDGDDDRTSAQRRVDGLDEALTRILDSGLPSTDRIKPHVSVVVHDETLKGTLNGAAAASPEQRLDLDAEPAILEGFGPIGPALLAYIAFGGTLTPILVAGFKENRRVLDVGRSKRIATKKQAAAIRLRQRSTCANRGCHHPIGEIHHVTDWQYGGKTNLNNLVGLCRKCHALATLGKLIITGTWNTGYTFTASRTGPQARTG